MMLQENKPVFIYGKPILMFVDKAGACQGGVTFYASEVWYVQNLNIISQEHSEEESFMTLYKDNVINLFFPSSLTLRRNKLDCLKKLAKALAYCILGHH